MTKSGGTPGRQFSECTLLLSFALSEPLVAHTTPHGSTVNRTAHVYNSSARARALQGTAPPGPGLP
jgi:hypothetical protein